MLLTCHAVLTSPAQQQQLHQFHNHSANNCLRNTEASTPNYSWFSQSNYAASVMKPPKRSWCVCRPSYTQTAYTLRTLAALLLRPRSSLSLPHDAKTTTRVLVP